MIIDKDILQLVNDVEILKTDEEKNRIAELIQKLPENKKSPTWTKNLQHDTNGNAMHLAGKVVATVLQSAEQYNTITNENEIEELGQELGEKAAYYGIKKFKIDTQEG